LTITRSQHKRVLLGRVAPVLAVTLLSAVGVTVLLSGSAPDPAVGERSPSDEHYAVSGTGGPTLPTIDPHPIADGVAPSGRRYTIAMSSDNGLLCHAIQHGEARASACGRGLDGRDLLALPAYFGKDAVVLALVGPDVARVAVRGGDGPTGTATALVEQINGYRIAHLAVAAPPETTVSVPDDGTLPDGAPPNVPVPQDVTVTALDSSGRTLSEIETGGPPPS
jgi:hypothetical protein